MELAKSCCVYCGKSDGLTRDHVPPKALFAKPRPGNLIAVDACKSCNTSASKDDEYFRLVLCFSEDAGNHPAVRLNTPSVMKSLQREEAKGFTKAFFASIELVDLTNGSGIWLGEKPAMNVDLVRLKSVVARTVRGLFFHESGRRLPSTAKIAVLSQFELSAFPMEGLEKIRVEVVDKLATVEPTVIGDSFSYRFKFVDHEKADSAWALTFYGAVIFLAIVKDDAVGAAADVEVTTA